MKHTAKIIIPLILVFVLLLAGCWFFLIYRTDITTGIMAYWGDHYRQAGRYGRAITFYDAAAKLSPDNYRIPIVLAQTYVLDDNYTKAEYTLVSAITNIPTSLELYVALSQTYVAQDKLLDAQQMLSRITNEEVRASIEALRPAAPVIQPESGYFNDYIDVSVESSGGVTYLTTSGEFPCAEADLYTGPVTLDSGETAVTAITVAENGLVSDAVYAGYTVGNVVEAVTISDPALDTYVRELLGKTSGEDIMTDELWDILELTLPAEIESLSDLTLFTNLQSLTARGFAGLDLSILSQLTTLRHLDLAGCTLSTATLELIGTLPDLTYLDLSGCAIGSINALVGLTKLTYLDLTNNSISDITAISSMTELTNLYLGNNPLDTITYLNNCLALQVLNIENCGVSKLSSIAGNTAITELYAANNTIEDISILEGCTALSVLDVSQNKIADISVLPKLPALTVFTGDNNKIAAVPVFDKAAPLLRFSINYNQVTDLTGLAGLQSLNYVEADYNKITDASVLNECYLLIQVNLWDNPLKADTLKSLEDMGVIVTYNPTFTPEEAAAA